MKEFDKDIEILTKIRGILEQQIDYHVTPVEDENPLFERISLTEAVESKTVSSEDAWKSGFVAGLEYTNREIIGYLLESFKDLNDEEEDDEEVK